MLVREQGGDVGERVSEAGHVGRLPKGNRVRRLHGPAHLLWTLGSGG